MRPRFFPVFTYTYVHHEHIFTLVNVRAVGGRSHLSSGSYIGVLAHLEEPDTRLTAAEEGFLAPAVFLGC